MKMIYNYQITKHFSLSVFQGCLINFRIFRSFSLSFGVFIYLFDLFFLFLFISQLRSFNHVPLLLFVFAIVIAIFYVEVCYSRWLWLRCPSVCLSDSRCTDFCLRFQLSIAFSMMLSLMFDPYWIQALEL